MKITVFTPTYNRAYILNELRLSLVRQTNKDFEWLIIDDGSSDNTEDLVKSWTLEGAGFPIRYYKVPNGGKCRAINKGLDLAEGELFFTVDSDDVLTEDAIEKVIAWEKQLPKNQKFAGIVANRGFTADKTINMLFDGEFRDVSLLYKDYYKEDGRLILNGERAFVFYTDLHKKYKYPEFENENFMTEAVAWNRMAHDGYIVRFYNDIIWIFEYLEDGLTKSGHKIFIDNPYGYGLWIKEQTLFMKNTAKSRFCLYYGFYCDLKDFYSVREIAKFLAVPVYKISFVKAIKSIWDIRKKKVIQ